MNINSELGKYKVDEERLKKMIFECAALQYSAINIENIEFIDLETVDICSKVFTKEIKRRVKEIILVTSRKINIILQNGKIIGREMSENGSNNDKCE